jgi:hypothetical protein
MHASIACLFLYEDYVWVSLGKAMKAKHRKACYIRDSFASLRAVQRYAYGKYRADYLVLHSHALHKLGRTLGATP